MAKKSLLIAAGLLTTAAAAALGAGLAPAAFAEESSSSSQTSVVQEAGNRQTRPGMMGPHGTVTAIDDHGDGSGTITLTLTLPELPDRANAQDDDRAADREEKMNEFFDAHPDMPRPGDDVTVAYNKETKFVLDGKESSAADVSVGMTITAHGVRPDSDDAAVMITDATRPPMARGNMHGARGDDRRGPRGVIGEVARVDDDAHTVTITLPSDHDETFTVGQRVHVGGFMPMMQDEESEK